MLSVYYIIYKVKYQVNSGKISMRRRYLFVLLDEYWGLWIVFLTSDYVGKIINRKSTIVNLFVFPPESGIILPFENPPDIFGAIGCFVYEVPAGIKEGRGSLHLGGCFTGPTIAG